MFRLQWNGRCWAPWPKLAVWESEDMNGKKNDRFKNCWNEEFVGH